MAARVNGEGILFSDYEEELNRYKDAVEITGGVYDEASARQAVMDEMVNQVLLAQSARGEGYQPDTAAVQAQYEQWVSEVGGEGVLKGWMLGNHYTEESFRRALERELAALWMRNRIQELTPTSADQVHARQILVRSEKEAIAAERRLQVGTDFTTLAYEFDPLTGGELGWFPAGYLLQPDVENAAFALQPGQASGIIPTSYGFHIVYVIERDPSRPLSADALLFKQHEALADWLSDQKNRSEIESLVN